MYEGSLASLVIYHSASECGELPALARGSPDLVQLGVRLFRAFYEPEPPSLTRRVAKRSACREILQADTGLNGRYALE